MTQPSQTHLMAAGQTTPLFAETQRFGQWWLRALLLILFGVPMWGVIQQVALGKSWGDNPAPNAALILLAFLFGLVLPVFMLSLNLRTEVRRDGIYVRFWPLHLGWVSIPPAAVTAFEACTYRPLRDYGGWGIRWGPKGKAYNVSGNRGVMLTLEGRRRLLLGSQHVDELAKAIATMKRGEGSEAVS